MIKGKYFFSNYEKMHQYWAYGLALIVIILLLISAALIAREENQEDKREKRVRFAVPRERRGVSFPLDFGAL